MYFLTWGGAHWVLKYLTSSPKYKVLLSMVENYPKTVPCTPSLYTNIVPVDPSHGNGYF